MGTAASFVLVLAAVAPSVEVVTLQGNKQAGTLEKITAEKVLYTSGGKQAQVPLSELMYVGFPKTAAPKEEELPFRVRLVDGTALGCRQFTTDGKTALVTTSAFGVLKLPASAVASVRFAKGAAAMETKWAEYLGRKSLKDYLVVNRGKTLDHLTVVVANVTEKQVEFVFNGQTQPMPREGARPVYGIVFSRRTARPGKAVAALQMAGGDMLNVSAVAWDGARLQATLVSGVRVEVPVERLAKLDYSLGKIKYLSDLEPLQAEFTPYLDTPFDRQLFQYRRDQTDMRRKLQLGQTKYDRGLWIHSRTRLKYRIDGGYRRFRAVMGIDYDVAQKGLGSVHVTISGDGRKLFDSPVRAADPPKALDLDVAKVRDLEILVDYGPDDQGTGDHLDLCDARLIK